MVAVGDVGVERLGAKGVLSFCGGSVLIMGLWALAKAA